MLIRSALSFALIPILLLLSNTGVAQEHIVGRILVYNPQLYIVGDYANGNTPCAEIAEWLNIDQVGGRHYGNPRYVEPPGLGTGCMYLETHIATGVIQDIFRQNYVIPHWRCPTGYNHHGTYCARPLNVIVDKPDKHCSEFGNPISCGSGAKIERTSDAISAALSLSRTFRSTGGVSSGPVSTAMGVGWHSDLTRRLTTSPGNAYAPATAFLYRADGTLLIFTKDLAGSWRPEADLADYRLLELNPIVDNRAWSLEIPSGQIEYYDSAGQILQDVHDGVVSATYLRDGRGLITGILDSTGRQAIVHYYEADRIKSIQSPDGATIEFTYDAKKRLSWVIQPDLVTTVYSYVDIPNQHGTYLSAITHDQAPYAAFGYDTSGRATTTEHTGGAGRHVVTYAASGQSASVEKPLGSTISLDFAIVLGSRAPTARNETSSGGTGPIQSNLYDSAGNLLSRRTSSLLRCNYFVIGSVQPEASFSYPTSVTACPATAAAAETLAYLRAERTTWHPGFNKPTERRVFNADKVLVSRQTWTYNARGQVETARQIDPVTAATRTTNTTYCEQADVDAPGSTCPILGLRKAIDGPRTDVADVTTFAYYPSTDESGCATGGPCHRKGDLWTVSNALGQAIWHLRYDRAGRLLRSADSNGTLTDFEYHPRGWLSTRTVRARADGVPDAGDAITHIDYLATGLVDRVTQPDGSYTDYDYDPAQRLTTIRDRLGNRIDYVLDAAGNRTEEKTYDPGNQLRRRLAREYNQLGRLWKERDAVVDSGNPNGRLLAEHHYDGNGNRDWTLDGLSRQSDHEYDPLDRLKKTLDALNPRGITQYGYDALDRLVTVTDPKNLVTEYVYDGLGDQRELRSPDTGTTVFTYDSAGNRQTQTDARSITTTYGYDVLNRPTTLSYPDTSLNVSFQYDQANAVTGCATSYPVGRLTRLLDASGSTTFCYDRRGNVTRKTQVTAGQTLVLAQTWTLADRLASITYPDGAIASYGRDLQGRVTTLTVTPAGGSATAVLTNITYLPFGPAQTYSFASGGQTLTRSFDQNYGLIDVVAPGLALHFRRDVLGNIDRLGTAPGAATAIEQYAYDPLYRLKDVLTPSGGTVEGYSYDATGNRLSKTAVGITEAYTYPAGNHRLSNVAGRGRGYDANGNTTAFEGLLLAYDQRNRLSELCLDGGGSSLLPGEGCVNWHYNGRGERVATVPSFSADWTYSLYGESGSLLTEQRPDGSRRNYFWADNLPIAVLDGTTLHYVHADHLGTPRSVSTPAGPIVWTWPFQANPFGERPPNEDPDGNGKSFVLNLRFPGQYQDPGSRISYNYFRDYEPATGRYLESDPIGLDGGISTFGYVGQNPLKFTDPTGEAAPAIGWCLANPLCRQPILKACEITLTAMASVANWMVGTTKGCDSNECESEEDRCRKADDKCYQQCAHHLGTDRMNQGVPYRNCWRRCMQDAGCYRGNGP